jgi:hypothetical protein
MVLGADDTAGIRCGLKIRAKACYRDTVRSPHKRISRCFGLKGEGQRGGESHGAGRSLDELTCSAYLWSQR